MNGTAAVSVCAALLALAAAHGAEAQVSPPTAPGVVDAAIDAAVAASGLPRSWIEAVIAAESGGDPSAVSLKGARGLMQLMPGTWGDLRAELRLGPDPSTCATMCWPARSTCGALYDRFGWPDLFAAYNSGPERLARHRADGSALPAETRVYVARLALRRAGPRARPADWRRAPLFPPGFASPLP